jgi:NAD-dependent dihydropyrimidine dehydrogenase PreA subunit
MLSISPALSFELNRKLRLDLVHVVPTAIRCMQCGICSFNCPAGIDVRAYAWRGLPVDDSACLRCGQCIVRCPRRVLRFDSIELPA